MLIAYVAYHVVVLSYMEDLWRTYIFADFLYLDQLIPHPSSHTLLLSIATTGIANSIAFDVFFMKHSSMW
jgi:hypothetical protein